MSAVNLDDTSRCPLGHRCEACGVERDDLAVCTAVMDRIGVTMCPRCANSGLFHRCRWARRSD